MPYKLSHAFLDIYITFNTVFLAVFICLLLKVKMQRLMPYKRVYNRTNQLIGFKKITLENEAFLTTCPMAEDH
jgi:hypothetical protein